MVFSRKGFTLVELLIVIAIIGLLALLALPRFFQAIARTKEARAKEVIYQIRQYALAEETINGGWGTYVNGDEPSLDVDGDGLVDYQLRIPVDPNYDFKIDAGGDITAMPTAACGSACDEFTMIVGTGALKTVPK